MRREERLPRVGAPASPSPPACRVHLAAADGGRRSQHKGRGAAGGGRRPTRGGGGHLGKRSGRHQAGSLPACSSFEAVAWKRSGWQRLADGLLRVRQRQRTSRFCQPPIFYSIPLLHFCANSLMFHAFLPHTLAGSDASPWNHSVEELSIMRGIVSIPHLLLLLLCAFQYFLQL